jgi:hypothetical protein
MEATMPTQLILWTLIPRAFDGERLKFSVFISPKLEPEADPQRLDTFPDFVVWPNLLNDLKFGVAFSNGQQVEAERDPDSPQAEADLWSELFHADTFVRGAPPPNFDQRLIHTYHVRDTLGYLKQVYKAVGLSSPGALPGVPILGNNGDPNLSRFIDLIGPNRGIIAEKAEGRVREAHNKAIETAMRANKVNALDPDLSSNPAQVSALGFNSPQEYEFFLADRFYTRPENKDDYLEKPDLSKVPPPVKPPELDFHQMLTLLTDHPTLMRRFGVVVDLVTKLPDPIPPSGWVRLLVDGVGNIQNATPRTQYVLDGRRFLPAPRFNSQLSDMRDGMLKLRRVNDFLEEKNNEQLFDLMQVDADGAVLKALNFALSMARLETLDTFQEPHLIPYDTPQDAGLPSLQTHGIALARRGRAFAAAQRLKEMAARNSNPTDPNALLFADDLLRGYRPDVLDETVGKWLSLNQRVGAYHFPDTGRTEEIGEEGYLKTASTTSKDDQTSDLYLHETLFKWAGWSLVAPRPGKTVVPKRTGLQQGEEPTDVQNEAGPDFRMAASFRAMPGTLPRLRFGRAYRLRARMVDLAGNSVPDDAIDDEHVSDAIQFTRFEPVIPPAVMLRSHVTEGESVEHLVIRSNYDQTTAEYVADPAVQAALQGKPHTYATESVRHIAPPKTSQLMAETHGMFDAAVGQGQPAQARADMYAIAARESGTYYDVPQAQLITPPELAGKPGVITSLPPKPPSSLLPAGERLEAGQYVIYPHDGALPLPYLPDVFARGAAFRALPGANAATAGAVQLPDNTISLRLPFDGAWPDAQPFRIQIIERAGGVDQDSCQQTFTDGPEPKWDADARLLTIFLPKAMVAKVQYSNVISKDDLQQMGIWKWLRESATASQVDALTAFNEGGGLWMITPFRTLTLVHAVQQPLCAPRFLKVAPLRSLGETFTRLSGTFRVSAKSTSKIDVMARWQEPVDNLADPGPKIVEGKARAFELQINPDSDDDQKLPRLSPPHEFGDTKHRLVEYSIVGTTRFREYFPPEITADAANITRHGEPWQPVKKTDGEGNVIEAGMHIPSSARPDSPRLVYVLPTFKWTRNWNGSTFTSRRDGGGLRVYLERTWYSSGADELLGVLLPGNASPGDELKPYITRWGKDPVYDSGRLDSFPAVSDFKAQGIRTGANLQLAELNATVTAVGHPVYYDTTRKLWYADVVLDSKASYYPFVRLALARYQPFSLNTVHLSRVVLADFAQLPPTRTLSVTVGADKQTLSVRIDGVAPKETGASKAIKTDPVPNKVKPPLPTDPKEGMNQFVVSVERRDVGIADEALGWEPEPLASVAQSKGRASGAIGVVSPGAIGAVIGGVIVPFNNLWKGQVVLPEPVNKRRYRLVVRELETFYADAFGQWLNKKIDRSRMVYAETVELTPELGITG